MFNILGLIFSLSSLAQNDTLNQYNSNHKKEGFWICYLDKNLKLSDSTNATYYGYELFDDGINRTHLAKRNMKVFLVKQPKELKDTSRLVLLDGKFILSNKNGTEKSIEEYRNGYSYIFRGLTTNKAKNIYDFEQEYLDFSKRYNNQLGSFYYEERSYHSKDTAKYWIVIINGKLKHIKIN